MKSSMILALLIVSINTVLAWGPTGHRAVGEVAQMHLSQKAKLGIAKLLDGHSLSRVSNWPDKIKSDPNNYSHTYNWHYTAWPDHISQHDPSQSYGTLLKSIKDNHKVFANPKAKKSDRAFALKFLVHLVGDLHQPLHVGNGLDKGGNDCKVIFQGTKTNLHRLWDEDMINFTKLSFTELARYVSVSMPGEITAHQTGYVNDWAKESREIRKTVYPEEVKEAKGEKRNLQNYCDSSLSLADEDLPKVGYRYSYKYMPILEKRIFQAGLRLAMLINQAF